jgi:hypothetical protein
MKRYACFTVDEQKAYEGLNERQRKYVDFRGQGYGKAQSYKMCGYAARNASQAAWIMERDNKVMSDLIERLLANRRAKELTEKESLLNKQVDALALQDKAEKLLQTIDGADGETARRIQFYRDILNGKIKSYKKTTTKDESGKIKSVKIEEVDDVDVRIKARKELDRILGLNMLPNIDNLQIGGITVNIVDASKKEELEDERNKVVLETKDFVVEDGQGTVE